MGRQRVELREFEEIGCSIRRGQPSNWSHPTAPFILPLLSVEAAGALVNWNMLEAARGTVVKVMRRPLCGSNFQDSTAEYVDVDIGDLAALLKVTAICLTPASLLP